MEMVLFQRMPVRFQCSAAIMLRDYHAFAVEVIPSLAERNIVIKLFEEDLDYMGYGGRLVLGKPSSLTAGIQRGGGLMYGRAACRVRGLAFVHKVWDAAAIAFGRNPVFGKK